MNKYRKILCLIIIALSIAATTIVIAGVYGNKPGDILLFSGEEQSFSLAMPYSLKIDSEEVYVSANKSKKVPADEITINLGDDFDLEADETGSYSARVLLFNLIPVDTIRVNVVDQEQVYIGGNIIGLALNTDGILVLGSGSVVKSNGISVKPCEGCLNSGDYIVEANGEKVTDKEQFVKLVQENGDNSLTIKVRRKGYTTTVEVNPVKAEDGSYKIGAWIRDDTAGVGTLTYYNPSTGELGTLGHGITDVDTGTLLDISSGELFKAHILSIDKGVSGDPGEIVGSMSRVSRDYLGEIKSNKEEGIFGNASDANEIINKLEFKSNDLYSIGSSYSVKKGYAQIVSCVLGEKEYFDIEITDINYTDTNSEKNIEIQVIDERLIDKTGGIIQGTSGSPIIQNGKLIGAVTHVTIDDPTKGYGIFIESMLEK